MEITNSDQRADVRPAATRTPEKGTYSAGSFIDTHHNSPPGLAFHIRFHEREAREMRVYYKRSIWGRILLILLAIPVVAFLAHLTYRWITPFLPFVGGAILMIVFVGLFIRRRRY
ncbi:hypothetical protein [Nonomuraea typhae]|uniref:Transmembrane protein n=1 Tax=Nonomuraea typhae TaxID=2603600 RepID=A0ABW7YJV2_9ACTN